VKGTACGPLFREVSPALAFIVEAGASLYIDRMVSEAQRVILCDHARLPWRFHGRLTAVQAGL
jgi:hypothetical protein